MEHSAALPTRVKVQPGEIEYHQACLDDLACLESGEFDAVVSASALEHNSPEKIPQIMSELRRTAKCGAPMLLTISTSPEGGEHSPSHSWLLTENEIVKAYSMPEGYNTNFAHMAQINQECRPHPACTAGLPLPITVAATTACHGESGRPSICR